jgi:2-dehydropantoate 2-reductase
MADRIRFAVLGPGAVGGLLAALLARSGDPVVVLAGDSTARTIADEGIRVESRRFGHFTARVTTAASLSEPVDVVLVTVKATHLDEAVQRVPASALGDALVVPFLNGLDHVDRLRHVYGAPAVVPAAIRIETTRIAPGVISHTSPFAIVDIGPRAAAVADHLAATGLDVRVRDDENAMLWDKLALLAPMALLTTHARASVGVIRRERRDDLVAVVEEATAIARADGVAIDPAGILRVIDIAPDAFETSMQRDQAAGRPLELDALGGALLRRAETAGIEAPVTRRLVEEIASRGVPPPAL